MKNWSPLLNPFIQYTFHSLIPVNQVLEQQIEHIVSYSPMRDHLPAKAEVRNYSPEEESIERKAEAEGFIQSVNTYFPELLTDKRVVALLDKAKLISES